MTKEQRGPQGWPALSWESRPWQIDPRSSTSRSQRRRHQGPYEAAVVPRIAGLDVRLPGEVLAEAEDAAVEISRFDGYASSALGSEVGDQPDGELAPLASILLRSESASSSQIENLTVGARQLALAEIGEFTGHNARIVARNVAAMRAALDLADRLDLHSLLVMHRALLADSRPDQAGLWRDQQVWIGGAGIGPHTASFVPPHHSRVEAALADLIAFLGRDDLPILVHAALAHAQFETIHPFVDGNGRTGRALIHAMLRGKGLTRRLTVPVSAGLLTDVAAYFDALGAYRQGDPVPVVRQLVGASFTAIGNGRELLDDLSAIRTGWSEQVGARRGSAARRLPDLLIRQPVVSNAVVADELGVSTVAAQNAIDQLVSVGALALEGSKSRNRVWQSPQVLAALDAFASRSGRRIRAT